MPGLCQAHFTHASTLLVQVLGPPPPEVTRPRPRPAPWGPVGASLSGCGCSAQAHSARSCCRNCRNPPLSREPKESGVSLAEPPRGSSHGPGAERRVAGSRGSPAKSRGGSSSDLSPVRARAARWATVGRTGRCSRRRLAPTAGSECEESHPRSCHHSAPPSEALVLPEAPAREAARSSGRSSSGSSGSLLVRSPPPGSPSGATCWAQELGCRRGMSGPALNSGHPHASGDERCRVKWRGGHRTARRP